jgi:ATP-binding cassette, subfamily B, bacterial MsbA
MASILPFQVRGPLAEIAWRYAWTVPAVALLGLLGSALEGAGIGLLIPLLTTLLASNPVPIGEPIDSLVRLAGGFDPDVRLLAIAGTIMLLIVLKNVVVYLSSIFVAWIDGRASHDVRGALAARLLTIGYPFFLAQDPARLVNIIATESWRASDAIRAIFSAAASLGSVVVFVALLLLIDVRLTLLVIAGTVAIRLIQAQLTRRLGAIGRQLTEANAALADRMLLSVWAMRLIRIYGQEPREQRRFEAASDKVRRIIFGLSAHSAHVGPLQEILHAALFIALLVGSLLLGAGVPLAALITFLVVLQRLQPHLRTIEGARAELAASEGAVREVEWLLDPAGKPEPPFGTMPFGHLSEAIEFREVEFQYATRPEGVPALGSASFTIKAGRTTALIGPSGSGKSTIVNLICRLYEPTAGKILIDGRPLQEVDPAQWRRRIGLAGQDIELLDGSIAENIRFGAPDASDEEVREAVRVADAEGFIGQLPKGYDTEVGSRGISLSGGQRQRISLARALVRMPDLLILDEATSAIDNLSEASIINRIRSSGSRMTVIVISHRASTLASCEEGIVIEGGVVKEAGPLHSLTAYRDLVPARSG